MLNQVILVGRIVKNPEIIENEEGKKNCVITLAVPRSYKNADGEYETDFIDCKLWAGIAETTAEYCKKGDLVGIRGKIETTINDDKKTTIIAAEKITFLSSSKNQDNKNEGE